MIACLITQNNISCLPRTMYPSVILILCYFISVMSFSIYLSSHLWGITKFRQSNGAILRLPVVGMRMMGVFIGQDIKPGTRCANTVHIWYSISVIYGYSQVIYLRFYHLSLPYYISLFTIINGIF